MKKVKSLSLMLVMVLLFLNLNVANAKAYSVIDLSTDGYDTFWVDLGGYDAAYSDNDYIPYVDRHGDASIYVLIRYNDNYSDIQVRLYNASTNRCVASTSSSERTITAEFTDLDPYEEYYLRISNRSSDDAELYVRVS